MPYSEFSTLLAGLNGETPLGHVVRIRSEKDINNIRKFSKEEKRIYNEWQKRKASQISREEYQKAMNALSAAFRSMAGGD